jgi:hypothetical protein
MNDIAEQLDLAGDALAKAWHQDHLRLHHRSAAPNRRRLVIGIVFAALVVGGGAALASTLLKSAADEETGMTEGYRLFEGSRPHCVSLSRVSFHCTLATAPTGETFYNQDGSRALDVFLGMTAETVDENKRVDGACVAVSGDGRSWSCFLGDAAVTRGLLSRELLGAYRPEPATA